MVCFMTLVSGSTWAASALLAMVLILSVCSMGCATQKREGVVGAQSVGPSGPIDPGQYFRITVVDEDTGRGIPMVRLTSCSNVDFYTDSAGVVAYHEPGLMNLGVFFHVESHGYSIAKDWLGATGRNLKTEPGGSAVLKMKRENIAQRLYRIAGSGTYADSVLLGDPVPIDEPLLNALVTGQDSTLATIYQGRLFWVWGDTGQPVHPLAANFKVTCATSVLPEKGGLDPEIGINLDYFKAGDGVKKMAPFEGKELVWLGSLMNVPDKTGRERLVARYARIKGPMTTVGRGLAEFEDAEQVFKEIVIDATDEENPPRGHGFKVTEDGTEYYYFFAEGLYRVPARYESVIDYSQYEGFTCLQQGATPKTEDPCLDRTSDGRLRYSWKKQTPVVGWKQLHDWKGNGHVRAEEIWHRFTDILTGDEVAPHGVTVCWNEYRKRYVMILSQIFGTSLLGEVWYAEADTPMGPWAYARKVVTHKDYTLYNPLQHPCFAKDGGRVIFFEGTYTREFSGAQVSTPRYNYNQIMYKLELDDPRLQLPVPIYRVEDTRHSYLSNSAIPGEEADREIAFYALEKPWEGSISVYRKLDDKTGAVRLELSSDGDQTPVAFYAEPADTASPSPCTEPLYVFAHRKTRAFLYTTDEAVPDADYARVSEPLCRVWKRPMEFNPFVR